MTIERLMCPPHRRLSWEMLNEVDQRLNELKHMAAFASEISMEELVVEVEDNTRFTIPRDLGDRLAFCVLNVENRIDDLREFIMGVDAGLEVKPDDLQREIERLQNAKRRALAVADERSKENVALRLENERLRAELDGRRSCD